MSSKKSTVVLGENATFDERYAVLSEREKNYFDMMRPTSGVLYITSKPGLAKSSIAKAIARKMGYQYMDIRLSMIDETDMGLFPVLEDSEFGKVLGFAVPKWAQKANGKPTIIHFEELNRASIQVRNAALQILLEREIGTEFKFKPTVYMMASGNLGEEDGTDVEEFDAALNNRLIHVKHDLSAMEWITEFANENVHSLIVGYIKNYPEEFYKRPSEKNNSVVAAYATPRSWTFLSDYLTTVLGAAASDPMRVKELVQKNGGSYIGNATVKFLRYIDETMSLTIQDVLNNFKAVEPRLKKVNRDKKSELLNTLREMDIRTQLKGHQVQNLVLFLKILDEDETVGYLTFLIDKWTDTELSHPNVKPVLQAFKDYLKKISALS